MIQIDLLFAATMDAPSPGLKAAEPPLEVPEPPVHWTAETDCLPNASRGGRAAGSQVRLFCAEARGDGAP